MKLYRAYFVRTNLKPVRRHQKYLFFYNAKREELAILLHPGWKIQTLQHHSPPQSHRHRSIPTRGEGIAMSPKCISPQRLSQGFALLCSDLPPARDCEGIQGIQDFDGGGERLQAPYCIFIEKRSGTMMQVSSRVSRGRVPRRSHISLSPSL